MNSILTATEIDAWAKAYPRQAQELLPELIARLVLCSSSKIEDYNFPIEKGIQFAGYDGVLNSGETTSYFPEGKSVWEFGTNDNALEKFKSDIGKRHCEPLGVDVNETTFIFATLKIWNHKTSIEEAINESKRMYTWKDIRIIDGSKIALWLQSNTAVAIWCANAIGKHVSGIRTIEDFWNDYCESTSPKLNQDFFMLGRDSQIKQLSEWLEKKSGALTIVSESSLESTLFIAAFFLKHYQKYKDVLNKTLIVESPSEWNHLIIKKERDYLLIPIFNFTEDIRCPSEMSIILPVAKYSPLSKITKNVVSIKIEKRSKDMYHRALETLGFELEDFSKIGTETKRSFLPLYRMITTLPSRKKPQWLSGSDVQVLIPAFLAGGWNGNIEGDRETIKLLSGLSYEEYIQKISKWLSMEDAPIFKVFNVYQVVSVQDMWTFLYELLTDDQIERFRECAISIFKAEDPTFELPEEQWPMASIYGKESRYSGILREGITISLILLSEQGERENNCNITSAESYVYSLAREIFDPIKTWKQWNTIAPSMTLLAESSPVAFLEKIEQEVSNEKSEIWYLFKPAKDILWGRSYYTHILWSLEQLVWYESYVIRAIDLLVTINEKDFNYTLANSPINTLYEIFCIWHPQCCLSCMERIEILKRIYRTYPITGWALISKLIPTGHSSCGTIQKPRWHSFETEFVEGVTGEEYSSTLQAIANIAIGSVTTASQWSTIIKNSMLFFSFNVSWLDALTEYCNNASKTEKLEISDMLQSEISRSRKFCSADWAIPEEHLKKMEMVLSQVLPDGLEKYTYLFKRSPDILNPVPFDKDNFNYEKEQTYIHNLRIETIHEILDKYGADTLIDFSLKAESTEELAEVIVEDVFHGKYDFSQILSIKSANYSLYSLILYYLYQINKLEIFWQALCAAPLTNEDKADIICQSPLDFKVWSKLDELDDEIVQYYWEHIGAFRFSLADDEHVDYFLNKLLQHNRPFSAARIIVFSKYSNSEMIMSILRKCCELQNHTEPTGMTLNNLAQHDILNLFEKLYDDQNLELDQLVQLEISFFPYFRYSSTPKGIIKHLLKHPIEYVTLITYNYKADFESDSSVNGHSPEQCRLAYAILDLFNIVPGYEGGLFSEEKFVEWITSAQEYANQIGYKNSFACCLGHLLSYAPAGNDGIFPHEIVRNYLEQNHSEKLINGFITGKQNQRGVHVVTGGLAEKEIAQRYREDASAIRLSYPRTAAVLEKLSDCYWQESLYEQKSELLDFRG